MKKRLPRVYIAAPYNGGNDEALHRAIEMADTLALIGYTPFVPHLNHLWNLMFQHHSSFWRNWDDEWIPCCDVLYRLSGDSDGADAEVALAKQLGIPVVNDMFGLELWKHQVWGTND